MRVNFEGVSGGLEPGWSPVLDPSIPLARFESLSKRVQKELRDNLRANEPIRVILIGAHMQAMIGTDTRVFVCKPGFMAGASFGLEATSWSYVNLVGVQVHRGLMSGSVVLQGPGQKGTRTSYWGSEKDDPSKAPNAIPVKGDWEEVQRGAARLRQLIDEAHRPTVSHHAPGGRTSIADEVQRLAALRDRDLLTADEFAAAKKSLLGG